MPTAAHIIDRSFLYPGMAVTSLDTNSGQSGVVTGVTTALDLVQLDEPTVVVATGMSPVAVRQVKELSLGDYIVSGPWLGRVHYYRKIFFEAVKTGFPRRAAQTPPMRCHGKWSIFRGGLVPASVNQKK